MKLGFYPISLIKIMSLTSSAYICSIGLDLWNSVGEDDFFKKKDRSA